jgi:predicted unusual protein kinase regulating ubiquinone biosynthesis (AarF/ABC1/UbiB family)
MSPDDDKPEESSRVPSGRLNRFLQISATAGRMAAGGLAESARRMGQKAQQELPHVLLTGQNARLLASRLARLRGAAMKVGQMLSMEGDTVVPPEFAQALEVLRSSAHRMPRAQVESVLKKELGSNYLEKFASLDLEPMKAASIGQVHRAKTLEGVDIVLKVQYPGVAESIDSDVDNLRSLLTVARILPKEMNMESFVDEVKRELHREVDYLRELRQQEEYRRTLGDFPGVTVPRCLEQLSSPRVLAMEYASGRELLKWAKQADQKQLDKVGETLIRLFFHELFVLGRMQTDPNPANYLYDQSRDLLVLLDFGATREVSPETREIYRKSFSAIVRKDEADMREVIAQLGVTTTCDTPAVALIIEIASLAGQVLTDAPFDFGHTNLARVIPERAKAMVQYRGEVSPPPPEYVFFQRKLIGTFLLCANLKARVNSRALLAEYGVL